MWLLPSGPAAQTGNAAETPRELLERGKGFHRQGALEEAAELYLQAIPGLRDSRDQEGLAAALNGLSLTNISFGRYADALEQAAESSQLRHALGDRVGESISLSNMGLAYYYLGEFQAALERFRQALDLDRRNQDPEGQVANLNNIGNVFFLQGNYSAAWDFYQQAMGVIDRHRQETWASSERYRTLVNLAALFQKLGLYGQALDLYSQLRDSAESLPASEQAQLLVNLGVLHRRLGDPVKAEETYRRAKALFDAERYREGQILALKNLGIVQALDLGDLATAAATFSRAQELASSSSDSRELMQVQLYLAETLLRQGLQEKAEALFAASLSLARRLGSPEEAWKSLHGLGRIASSRGHDKQAGAFWEEAVSEIESLRSRLQSPTLRSGFLADKREVFDSLIDLYLRRGDESGEASSPDPIVAMMERARRQSFREQFALDPAGSAGDPSVLRKLRELKAEMTRVWLSQLSEQQDVDALRSRLAELENEYLKTERQLNVGAEISQLQPPSVSEIQAQLGEDTALTLFWVGQERFGGVFVSRAQSRLFQKAFGPPERRRVAFCAAQLAQPDGAWREACGPVGGILSGDWLAEIQSGKFRRLIVVPDRLLNSLPFEVLFNPDREGLMVERVSVSYLPDLGFLQRPRPVSPWRPPWAKTLAAFGNPQKSEKDEDFLEGPVGELTFSEREVQLAAEQLPGRTEVFVGAAATRKAFARSAQEGYPILHLASHAEVDALTPQRSRIALSPQTQGAPTDFLFLGEIPNLPLRQVDLVVLSACETAGGREGAGSVESFGRAFLYAGASSTLATLWRIDDRSSAAFMRLFYRFAAEGADKSEALRLAKLRFLESDGPLSHPYYWAGFVLYGRGDAPLPLPWSWTSIITAALLLTAAAAAGLAWRLAR